MSARCPHCGDDRTIHIELSQWRCLDCWVDFYKNIHHCPPSGGDGELDELEPEEDKSR